MKIFAPGYYKKFKCIAEACRHSCCIGWEIDVDADAVLRYRALCDRNILESIDFSAEAPHFELRADGRCPHLDGRGLCRIICEHGEEYLCDICREHPRFYNFSLDRCEVGLGVSCQEAARLVLESGDYLTVEEVGERDGEGELNGFNHVSEREKIYAVLSDLSISYSDRLLDICRRYGIDLLSDAEGRKIISSLEYLDTESEGIFSAYRCDAIPKCEKFCERALAYFIYRHTGEADSLSDFKMGLGLALFLERLFASLLFADGSSELSSAVEFLRRVSEEIEYSEENIEIIKNEYL